MHHEEPRELKEPLAQIVPEIANNEWRRTPSAENRTGGSSMKLKSALAVAVLTVSGSAWCSAWCSVLAQETTPKTQETTLTAQEEARLFSVSCYTK